MEEWVATGVWPDGTSIIKVPLDENLRWYLLRYFQNHDEPKRTGMFAPASSFYIGVFDKEPSALDARKYLMRILNACECCKECEGEQYKPGGACDTTYLF
jgi:hypothetical protein